MIQITPPQNPGYWINQRALTFSENDLDNPNRVAVSLVSGTVIMAYEQGVIDYAADGNFQKWTLKGYSTKLIKNDAHYVYARLSRTEKDALIVFSVNNYNLDGSVTTTDADGKETTSDPSEFYFYIKIGELTATDGESDRELTYDSGALGTDKDVKESSDLNEMFELSKTSTLWLIFPKYWFYNLTVKGFITMIAGFILGEKKIVDIKRSIDSDNPEDDNYVPVSDDNLATSKYVESKLENLDERYLSKIKPDETPYHIKLLGGLTTKEAESDDYAQDTLKGGWAAKKNIDNEWYLEADHLIARILANVYDLLVQNNAVFKGNLSSEEFISGFIGGKGWAIRMLEWVNAAGVTEKRSVAEFDDLIVRGTMRVYEFIVSQMLGENDNRIFTGMMEVDHYDASDGKIYLKTDGGKLYNPFRVDDIIMVQQYGGMPSEENDYYVTKQYEFLVTEVGIGSLTDGEDRLDWVKFTNFSTMMEGGDESLIAERDTLVRLDNLSDVRRKGIIQVMSVGENTPYIDILYGVKTDPDNSLKGRLGNLTGVYNPLFGWLKEFGAYLTNLYAVGEFRIAHTGEDVADAIEIAKGTFRTNYRQTTYDMSEEDNYFTNASMTNDCEYWTLGNEATSYFLVDNLPQFFNYNLYASEDSFAGIAEYNGRDMLRLSNSMAKQTNDLIKQPGTHKVHTSTTENDDGTYTKNYVDEPDTLYLSVRIYVVETSTVEFGFVNAEGVFYSNDFHYSKELVADEDAYSVKLSGIWDGVGDFCIKSSGDVYIDLLSLTSKPLENFMITTSTSIEQDAEHISLLGKKINGVEGSVTDLGIELQAAEERITLYVNKEFDKVGASVSQLQVDVQGVSTKVATAQGAADNAKKAADAAQTSANNAAAAALAAQNTADTANEKAIANASAITQQANSISLLTGAFDLVDDKYVLTSAAGAVITSETAKLYATKTTVNSLGDRVTAAEASITTNAEQISLRVMKNGVISAINQSAETITISASRVNLTGVVTYSMLNSSLQDTLDDKAEKDELNQAKTDLNSSMKTLQNTLQASIDTKASAASVTSLNDKVAELNSILTKDDGTSALKNVAYIDDAAAAAIEGSMIVVNGYLNTDYIKVDTIWATKGTVGGFAITDTDLTSSSGVNSLLLTSSGIVFSGEIANVYLGAHAGISSATGINVCPFSVILENSDYGTFNIGSIFNVTGASIQDGAGLYGNCAIYLMGGHIAGFRMKQRRIATSQTLKIFDNVIICTHTTGTLTITLPSGCEDGQEYWITTANGQEVKVQASTGDGFAGGSYGSFSSVRWHMYRYDAVNSKWRFGYLNL